MCEVLASGDSLIFKAPEIEAAFAYLSVRDLAERVEWEGGSLHIAPAHSEVEMLLRSICSADVTSLLLDLKESLLHMGWLVAGRGGVARLRRSWRLRSGGFVTVEYDSHARQVTVSTTDGCIVSALERLGFAALRRGRIADASRRVSSLVEVLELGDSILRACQ
jgi:hypothetical protein